MKTLTPQQDLYCARAYLLAARNRIAMHRRLGDLNSIDREMHANAVEYFYHALDQVWAAQQATA